MRVVVGQEARALRAKPQDDDPEEEAQREDWGTPLLSDRIEYIVLNPYWNVPHSITVEELLPALQEDSERLAEQRLEVVSGWDEDVRPVDPDSIDWDELAEEDGELRLRQLPGPHNALGRIKFMLPNPMNIYLHDSPEGALFEETQRDFSHGCIRLERPLALAVRLLEGDPDWDEARIRRAIESEERVEIDLPEPVPIHVLYWTAIPSGQDRVAFHRDLYGIDEALRRALGHRRPRNVAAGSP